jgi:hypothetical protein
MEPEKPFAPVTVMTHEPDCPGAVMLIVEELQPGVTLIPVEPTVTVTEAVVELAT